MSCSTRSPRTRANPLDLRAMTDLLARGWTRDEIMAKERICRATFYNRLREIRRLERTGHEGDE